MIRVGLGYDSHRFQPPGPLVLGGLRIPFDNHLHGHSDGDAVCHALTDAILGAAGAGDIGELFSDQDAKNLGRDSVEMLQQALTRVRRDGFTVQQADVTVIAESPRLGPHKALMQARLAGAMGLQERDVSIKAKTNEGMGWIGRGEGIAVLAIVTLERA
ncbi:MAG TPA: 2-C-methyl-D-erythritol 2,4-cyclodiphosphate synthase [Gemmatimonadaceae bacterium]|nr:2-C-methyl-D-erythritol 2,4-cyclodiphosphate synthase [Gemmatimonadaceae bacterium]